MNMLASDMLEFPPISSPEAWDAVIPFDEIETPEITAALLPEPFRGFASALANETETAESLSVMTILGVLSAVLAKKFIICPRESWNEPINIYALIALPPANNKSLVLNRCTDPLVQWEKEQATSMEYDIKRRHSERKTEEKIIEGMRKQASTIKDQLEQKDLADQIATREASLIEIPVLPQIFANDTTPESLVMSVYEQDGRFAIFSDEGGIMDILAGLYSNGNSNVDILLKGIDGGELRVRRKDRSFNLNPYLTIVLAIQPAILQKIAEKRSFIGNGALERFLYVIPKSKLGYRLHNKPALPAHLVDEYNLKVSELLSIKTCSDQPYKLLLTDEALKIWREFQQVIEKELRPEGKLAPCQGWGGKICGFTLRIAGLLHVGQFGNTNHLISEQTMECAIYIAQQLVEHAIAAYGLMGCDQATDDAKAVFYWITNKNKTSFNRTELLTAMRNRQLGKVERLNKAIEVLINRNILSPPITVPTKKPTILYQVNPCITDATIKEKG